MCLVDLFVLGYNRGFAISFRSSFRLNNTEHSEDLNLNGVSVLLSPPARWGIFHDREFQALPCDHAFFRPSEPAFQNTVSSQAGYDGLGRILRPGLRVILHSHIDFEVRPRIPQSER